MRNTVFTDRNHTAKYRPVSGSCVCAALVAILLFMTVFSSSCREKITVLDENIHGFYLGETKDQVFDRIESRISWTVLENPHARRRGEMYELSRVLMDSKGVDRAHLTFLDGRLMEIIIYYTQTNVSKLIFLKGLMEERFGGTCTYPDGTIEMAYKTYWLKGPGMSITIRRITKKPEDELYVQYLHNELHEKLKKKMKRPG